MRHETPFNPLDKRNLGISVADALLERSVESLPPREQFIGAGINALYYTGYYVPYAPIAERNREQQFTMPVYVGKAVPRGARKGGFGLDDSPGTVLYDRLAEHAESIQHAENLNIQDFHCRYLVVDDIWIPLGESLLIQQFSPAWNLVIEGFGNHDPGSGRYNQQKSPWDTLHPGRSWALRLRDNRRNADEILQLLIGHHGRWTDG